MTTIIKYVDALAGAGKTYELARYAHKLALRGRKVLFVQPTKLLIDKTIAKEMAPLTPTVRVKAIHQDTVLSGSVASAIVDHFKNTKPGGEVLFVTHMSFLRDPYLHRKGDWIVICDEVPDIDVCPDFDVPHTHGLITPYLETVKVQGPHWRIVPTKDGKSALRDISRNADGDQHWRTFQGFASRIISDRWTNHVLENQYRKLVDGDGTTKKLQTFSLLQPNLFDGFAKVIVAGALFTETLMHEYWSNRGVKFVPFKLNLRYETHNNGHLLDIHYLSEEDWSKCQRSKCVGEQTVLQLGMVAIKKLLGAEPCMWIGNKDLDDKLFEGLAATRLPNVPHGLNGYQGIHNTVFLSALNPNPAQFAFLAEHGISSEQVRTAHYRNAVYQAYMRSSARNPVSTDPKKLVVMDRSTAVWLANLFPGCRISALDIGVELPANGKPGRPKIHGSNAEKKAASTNKKNERLLVELARINSDSVRLGKYSAQLPRSVNEEYLSNENTLKRGGFVTTGNSLFGNIYESEAFFHLDIDKNEDFVGVLRDLHTREIARKDEAGLISAARFDPDLDSNTSRGLANVEFLRGIWFDNDGGDLTEAEFASLFPDLWVVAWNTFSSTKECPRWRVFIPTTHIMTLEAYDVIMDGFFAALKKKGYYSQKELNEDHRIKHGKHHGFDMSKRVASSLFYLPSQAQEKGASFFNECTGGCRKALNPFEWVERRIKVERIKVWPTDVIEETDPAIEVGSPANSNDPMGALRSNLIATGAGAASPHVSRVQMAIDEWRQQSLSRGQGHAEFFRLAAKLHAYGLTGSDLRQKLEEEAFHGRSPKKRRAEIAGIMKKLDRQGFWRRSA